MADALIPLSGSPSIVAQILFQFFFDCRKNAHQLQHVSRKSFNCFLHTLRFTMYMRILKRKLHIIGSESNIFEHILLTQPRLSICELKSRLFRALKIFHGLIAL
ncbi:hypothetical protein WJ12_05625 [Burkholderia seminalis]|nr:hypothetical protein WJ12_05625 [Burkholderia seminalis]